MAEYLNRAVEARANRPEDRRRLTQALAARQGKGAVLGAMTQGQGGRGLQRGPDAIAMEAELEDRARQEAYQRERDQIADEKWMADYQLDKAAAAAAGAGAAGVKPGAKALQNYHQRLATMGNIDEMEAQIAGLSPEAADDYDSPWYEITSGMLPESMKRRADEGFYAPEVDSIMRQGQGLESQIRRMFAGTAVTKYEGADTEKWSPMAPGLSADQRQRRMSAIRGDAARLNDEFTQTFGPDYARDPTNPPPEAAQPASTGKYTIISVE